MNSEETKIDDHSPLAHDILKVLESFIDELGQRGCTGHFNKVIDDNYLLKGKHLTQQPERFLEEHLVFPILEDAFDYSLRPQPKKYAPRWPRSGVSDFCVTSIPVEVAKQNDIRFFGEVKPPKKIERARNDMEAYLQDDIDLNAIAILTDGFDWELWVRPRNTEFDNLDVPYAEANLKEPLKQVRTRNMTVEPYRPFQVRNDIDSDAFSAFSKDSIRGIISDKFDIKTDLLSK